MLDMPFFMKNEDWYEFDFKKRRYVLTDKAPQEAKDSYEKYYQEMSKMNIKE